MDQTAHNLPPQLTTFIGRVEELNELKKLLADSGCRMATLVGPGGSGKTRLAVEAASVMANEFSDGVYFVPLEAVGSVELLVPAIVDSIEFSLRGRRSRRSSFNHLAQKRLLLVLDNFEHLVASTLLSDMLARPQVEADCDYS
jgi:predicted ATPase